VNELNGAAATRGRGKTFSIGLSSDAYGGRLARVMFSGTTRSAAFNVVTRTEEIAEVRATTKLRTMVKAGQIVVAPGAFDGLSARLVEQAGFPAVYASGGAIARSTGVPDLGLISPDEIAQRLAAIVDVVGIPVIADADTGYGNALNAQRAARGFERAGVAAFHLEDQTFPKKCGHYDDKSLVTTAEMVQKLHAVRDVLQDPDFIVIARTDAIAVEGFEAAIDRASAYLEAGADMVFVEAPTSEGQIADIARRLPGYKLINMFHGGKTPLLPVSRLRELGYHVIIIPSDTQRAAIKAMQRVLATISRDGSAAAMIEDMASFKEREAIVDASGFLARDKRYAP
jgi:2-methylisocitrate lyase-like PEP mutase family enzyme